MKNLRTLSVWEWLVCALGMFFIGLGMGYIDVQVYDYGIGFFIFGLILEIPAFYFNVPGSKIKLIKGFRQRNKIFEIKITKI